MILSCLSVIDGSAARQLEPFITAIVEIHTQFCSSSARPQLTSNSLELAITLVFRARVFIDFVPRVSELCVSASLTLGVMLTPPEPCNNTHGNYGERMF